MDFSNLFAILSEIFLIFSRLFPVFPAGVCFSPGKQKWMLKTTDNYASYLSIPSFHFQKSMVYYKVVPEIRPYSAAAA